MNNLKAAVCYILSLWLIAIVLFKIYDVEVFNIIDAYPLPSWLYNIIMTIEVSGAVLLFFSVKYKMLRIFTGFLLTPFFFGAGIFHLFFDWFGWLEGFGEVWYFIIPSILTYLGIIYTTHEVFFEIIESEFVFIHNANKKYKHPHFFL